MKRAYVDISIEMLNDFLHLNPGRAPGDSLLQSVEMSQVHCFLGGKDLVCRFREEWLIDTDPAIDIAIFTIAPERIKLLTAPY